MDKYWRKSAAETFLSPTVKQLLELGISYDEKNVLNSSGILNWQKLSEFVNIDDKNGSVPNHIKYKEEIAQLAPVFSHIQKIYEKIDNEQFINLYTLYLQWTHNEKTFQKCHQLIKNGSVDSVLAILILTAAIERALGNVYLLKGRQLPNLLKDLLMTSELEEIFGRFQMNILQIVIGPPISLNLRNIVWHGFIAPHEMQKCYGYFLLVLVISFGEILFKNGINTINIPKRNDVQFMQTSVWENYFPNENILIIKEVISSCPVISTNMKIYWEVAISKYEKSEFGDCLVLILPQLENCLRVIYATINNCPERILTAEVSTLYTTLEEVERKLLC